MRSRSLVAVLVVLCCSSALAQTAGNYVLRPNEPVPDFTEPFTIIDISSPVTANGVINTIAVRSSVQNACINAFKVKFFRASAGSFTPFAERGPFDINGALTAITKVTFTGVPVQTGDLLGITVLNQCAGLLGQSPLADKNAIVFLGDVVNPVSVNSAQLIQHFALGAYAASSANAEVRTSILVAAGSAQGAFGSQFRTDVFMVNPRRTRSRGRLVYHPEGVSGSPADPSFPFTIDFARSMNFPNFVADTLHLSGKGTIDVYTEIGFEPPQVSARIYETGTGGTKGFVMDALPEHEALDFELGDLGVLFTPVNPAAFRMNMGFRTLSEQTEIVFQLVRGNGVVAETAEAVYPPDFYQQVDISQFFGAPLQPGDTIFVFTDKGSAFVYGSIVDNTSNDPSIQIARPIE